MSISTSEYKKINKLAPEGYRYCRDCKEYLPFEKFGRHNPNQPGGTSLKSRCKHHDSLHRYKTNTEKDPSVKRLRPPLVEGNKVCTACDKEKPLVEFEKTGGVNGKCKPCAVDIRMKENYGITSKEYDEMLRQQDYKCANTGCRKTYWENERETNGRRMPIDHDHSCCPGNKSCGKCIRGLLCNSCNVAEGFLYSNPEKIMGLLKYLGFKI